LARGISLFGPGGEVWGGADITWGRSGRFVFSLLYGAGVGLNNYHESYNSRVPSFDTGLVQLTIDNRYFVGAGYSHLATRYVEGNARAVQTDDLGLLTYGMEFRDGLIDFQITLAGGTGWGGRAAIGASQSVDRYHLRFREQAAYTGLGRPGTEEYWHSVSASLEMSWTPVSTRSRWFFRSMPFNVGLILSGGYDFTSERFLGSLGINLRFGSNGTEQRGVFIP
jgi:hypothetical protein